MGGKKLISLDELESKAYCRILCYPKLNGSCCHQRISELSSIGVLGIEFGGDCLVNGIKVLGKGCVGIVVKAVHKLGTRALKIRRLDAARGSLSKEGEILRRVNRLGVGPRVYPSTKNFLLLEYVHGELIGKWIKTRLYTRCELVRVLKELLAQCYSLDKNSIDHGELSNASKHVLISKSEPVILDFESASLRRKASNLTKILHFLLFNKAISPVVEEFLRPNTKRIPPLLREYKGGYDEEVYRRILREIGVD